MLYFFLLVIIAICGIYYSKKYQKTELVFGIEEKADTKLEDVSFHEKNPIIEVEVAGEVYYPGVYKVSNKSIIEDVLEKAGGLALEADASKINLSDAVFDGEQIYVPKKAQQRESCIQYSEILEEIEIEEQKIESNFSEKININTASIKDLDKLPMIGEKIAENIVNYREEHGKFQSIEEIKKVPKIGDKIFQKIKNNILID